MEHSRNPHQGMPPHNLSLIHIFIELDVFQPPYEGLLLAEVEFPTEKAASAYTAPEWFGEEVTYSSRYHNSTLSRGKL